MAFRILRNVEIKMVILATFDLFGRKGARKKTGASRRAKHCFIQTHPSHGDISKATRKSRLISLRDGSLQMRFSGEARPEVAARQALS
jgi:hypothetical protein